MSLAVIVVYIEAFVDHLVFGCPDLDEGVSFIEQALGVRATPGGRHPGWGTRNALISLGESTYLEIIGPDETQPEAAGRRVFGVDQLDQPRLVTWAAKRNDLEVFATCVKDEGIDLGVVSTGSRTRNDGVVLSWRLTDPYRVGCNGLRPFFIDWGDTPHPAGNAAKGCTLVELRGEHPEPQSVMRALESLGLDLRVTTGLEPALVATIACPRGRVELR